MTDKIGGISSTRMYSANSSILTTSPRNRTGSEGPPVSAGWDLNWNNYWNGDTEIPNDS